MYCTASHGKVVGIRSTARTSHGKGCLAQPTKPASPCNLPLDTLNGDPRKETVFGTRWIRGHMPFDRCPAFSEGSPVALGKSAAINVDLSSQTPKSIGVIGRPRVPPQEGTDHSSGRGQGLQPGLQRPRPSLLVGERLGWRNRGREGQGVQSGSNTSLLITQR